MILDEFVKYGLTTKNTKATKDQNICNLKLLDLRALRDLRGEIELS
jgi:hypothetical protein